jgi:hypothetical protein
MLGSEEYGSSTTLNCQCDISLSSIWTTNVVASKTTFNYINKPIFEFRNEHKSSWCWPCRAIQVQHIAMDKIELMC